MYMVDHNQHVSNHGCNTWGKPVIHWPTVTTTSIVGDGLLCYDIEHIVQDRDYHGLYRYYEDGALQKWCHAKKRQFPSNCHEIVECFPTNLDVAEFVMSYMKGDEMPVTETLLPRNATMVGYLFTV